MNKFLNLKMYTKRQNSRKFLQSFLLRPFLKILLKIEIRDFSERKYLCEKRPIIIVANHSSHLDTPLVFAGLEKNFAGKIATAAAKDYFFRGGVKEKFARSFFNVFPIERQKSSRENSVRGLSKKIVQAKIPLLIFPEGTRSKTGEIGEFHTGIFRTAIQENAVILPIAILGAREVLPKGKSFLKMKFRGKICVTIGEILTAEKTDSPEKLAEKTRAIIAQNLAKK